MQNQVAVQPVEVGDLPIGEAMGSRTDWDKVLEPLKAKPGKWFMLRAFESYATPASTKRNLLRKSYKSFTGGEWDFQVRKIEGKWTLFGSYLGEGKNE